MMIMMTMPFGHIDSHLSLSLSSSSSSSSQQLNPRADVHTIPALSVKDFNMLVHERNDTKASFPNKQGKFDWVVVVVVMTMIDGYDIFISQT